MRRPIFYVLAAIVLVLAGAGIALAVTWNSSPVSQHQTVQQPKEPSATGKYCYIEISPPSYPDIWLQTVKTGGSNASCDAILSAAQSDSPPGSKVFLSQKPSPAVVITQQGGLTVLSEPGAIPKLEQKRIAEQIHKMLQG